MEELRRSKAKELTPKDGGRNSAMESLNAVLDLISPVFGDYHEGLLEPLLNLRDSLFGRWPPY